MSSEFLAKINKDPRPVHIAWMVAILGFGTFYYDFSLSLEIIAVIFCSGVLSHLTLSSVFKTYSGSILSSLITCTGLSLLVRTESLWFAAMLAALAIGSKFVLRLNGKHIFNPANFGVAIGMLCFSEVWVSAGHWGSGIQILLLLSLLGSVLVKRAGASELSLAFLFSYVSIWLVYRSLYLGYELEILLHSISSGSFIIFSFFMVSDPRTCPANRFARYLHIFLVAIVAHIFTYYLYLENGPILALFFLSILVPVWDYLLSGEEYRWEKSSFVKRVVA